jgi:hypothetical protein
MTVELKANTENRPGFMSTETDTEIQQALTEQGIEVPPDWVEAMHALFETSGVPPLTTESLEAIKLMMQFLIAEKEKHGYLAKGETVKEELAQQPALSPAESAKDTGPVAPNSPYAATTRRLS